MLEEDKLAAKQAELSKALSAAYLNHEISQLESQVRHLPLDTRQNGNEAGVGAANSQAVNGQILVPPPQAFRRIDDGPGDPVPQAHAHADDVGSDKDLDSDGHEDQEDWRVAVVDVSGLMWAPKAVRALVSKGFEVVVPADGIRTLDLLKKGNSPAAMAARSATRYIEHASRQHKVFSADPSLTVQLGTDYKRGIGLRIQRDDEFRRADELSSLPLMPGEEGPPKWVKSVLGCAAYFAGINKTELDFQFKESSDPLPVLYVANPPLAVELAQATSANGIGPETKEMRDQAENNGNYLERGEGVVVLQEAERFELGLEVLRDEDDESFDVRRAGGGGRGRGGRARGGGQQLLANGGRGGGKNRPRKEEEKQPEVKILLRRQQPAVDGDGQEVSPNSNVSPLPDVTPTAAMPVVASRASPLVKSGSLGSAPSAEISPPRAPHKALPHERKASNKFVPLTRETHPVRRQAGSSDSSDDDDSRPSGGRRGRGGGRGNGRGGGRGGGKPRERGKANDAEFKNGNFTLLQRPAPLPKEPSPPPPPSPRVQAPAPPPKGGAQRPPRGGGPPAIRGILARPPRGHGPGPGPGRPPPPPPGAGPPPFAPELRGRGRGRGGGRERGHFYPGPPHRHHHHHHHHDEFEFDDAMLHPGFGHPGGGGGHGFPPPPAPPHHHHHHSPYHFDGPRPGIWRPAPEQPAVVLLQRPK